MRPSRRFWFVLALALGATVGELQQRMGSHEFTEWQALFQMEPFGELRADFRSGQLSAVVANLFREKGAPVAQATDFMLPSPWIEGEQQPVKALSKPTTGPQHGSTEETRLFLEAMGAVRA